MVDEFLTDEQQAEVVKRWLRQNGLFMVLGVALGLGGLFGWNTWQDHQANRRAAASALFEELRSVVEQGRAIRAEEIRDQLVSEFGGTPYPAQARLSLAGLHMTRNDPQAAAAELGALLASRPDRGITHIAQVRLARVRLHQGDTDEALALLDVPDDSAFAGIYHDARGDVYMAREQREDARSEYELALLSEAGTVNREWVQMKLDDLGDTPMAALDVADEADSAGVPEESPGAAGAETAADTPDSEATDDESAAE